MTTLSYTQTGYAFSVTTPLGPDKLLLESFEGEELISGLFHFRLTMASEYDDLDFKQVVGKGAAITAIDKDGKKRHFHGIVARMVQNGMTYHFDLRPKLWELTLASDYRIFQNKTVPEIVKAVLQEQGITDLDDKLIGTYQKREYCVQYGETGFAFISRLMEEEGIFYFFEHEQEKHTLVLADDGGAFKPCPNLSPVPVKPEGKKAWEEQDLVLSVSVEESVVAGQYQADDFNFETPTTELRSKVDGGKNTLRIYDYPGLYKTKDEGDAYGKKRLDEIEFPARLIGGESICRAFTSGFTFTLTGHSRDDVNTTYVLRSVNHSGARRHYHNSFIAFPSTVNFRPPRLTPKPRIAGTQTAIVVGKSGEEIWTDEHGRIKVQFHWDQLGSKDENSSCWIRVAQLWAGKNWGAMFLPRIGHEVVVSFLDGDPDRPLVTGSVYNGQQPVPYALSDEQTKSTIKSNSSKGGSGFNELSFDDKAGSEVVQLHAQKDFKVDVLNDQTVTVGGNYTLKVTGNISIEATGTVSIKAGGGLKVSSDATMEMKASATGTIDGGGALSLKGGTVEMKASTAGTIDGGGALSLKGGMVKIN